MAYTPKKLNTLNRIPTGIGTSYYQVPTSAATVIKALTAANTTGSSATFSVYFSSSGQSTAASFGIINNMVLKPYETVVFNELGTLNSQESIWAVQTTAGAVNLFISGIEVT